MGDRVGNIENYWDDVTVYYVEFIVLNNNGERKKIKKVLVLDSSLSLKEVKQLMKHYFNNVIEIVYVDELAEGFSLRQPFYLKKCGE